jgi:hypothetical protein
MRKRGAALVNKTHDYIHHYRGYRSDGGKCRIRIYQEEGQSPVVICSQLPDNPNTSVTNMAEYLAAEVIQENSLQIPLTWIEYYPIDSPRSSPLGSGKVEALLGSSPFG